jgi:two-component system sensor histidine kinase AlgZ
MFLLYLAGWIPLGIMLGFLISATANLSAGEIFAVTTPVTTILAFVCLSPWYTCHSLSLRSARPALLWQHLIASIVVAGAVLLIARLTASAFSDVMPGLNTRFQQAVPVLTAMVTMLYLLSIALHYVVIEAQTSRKSELLARESQLKALKSQVNPHFLFNSLNSISALTTLDPARARTMCIRLADFLRTSLRLGEQPGIAFREEMALSRMYLDVEQVRFGARLKVSENIDEQCLDCQVPALIIQPLVENAVKHGIALIDVGGQITMQCTRDRDSMNFTIENPFDPGAPSSRSGIGLENVRQRLEARYGNSAHMEIQMQENTYRVALTIPMTPLEATPQ